MGLWGYWSYLHIFSNVKCRLAPCHPCQGERQLPPESIPLLEEIIETFPREKKKTSEIYSWPKFGLVGPYWSFGESCHIEETEYLGKYGGELG